MFYFPFGRKMESRLVRGQALLSLFGAVVMMMLVYLFFLLGRRRRRSASGGATVMCCRLANKWLARANAGSDWEPCLVMEPDAGFGLPGPLSPACPAASRSRASLIMRYVAVAVAVEQSTVHCTTLMIDTLCTARTRESSNRTQQDIFLTI